MDIAWHFLHTHHLFGSLRRSWVCRHVESSARSPPHGRQGAKPWVSGKLARDLMYSWQETFFPLHGRLRNLHHFHVLFLSLFFFPIWSRVFLYIQHQVKSWKYILYESMTVMVTSFLNKMELRSHSSALWRIHHTADVSAKTSTIFRSRIVGY